MAEISDSYIAGFFDGEGCVSVSNNGAGGYGYLLSLTNKDRRPLEKIQEKYGGKIGVHGSGGNCFVLKLTQDEAEIFAERILPHSIIKAKQLELYLEMRKLKSQHNKVSERRKLFREIRRLKGVYA